MYIYDVCVRYVQICICMYENVFMYAYVYVLASRAPLLLLFPLLIFTV